MKINSTIKLLMFSDIFVHTGFGLIAPILAIFITNKINHGTLFAVGIATAIYMTTKALIQLPFSLQVDKNHRSFSLK